MKLKKSIIMLAAAAGTGVLATAPATAAEYSSSVSGNIRVEALSVTSPNGAGENVEKLSTGFGGDEEESSTGGDTHLQWNHNYENDDGTVTGSGFIRFAGDGNIRINVQSTGEVGNYKGELKAEWERNGFNGVSCKGDTADTNVCTSSISERDQFAKLTHTGIGLFYKIGREEWFGNQKGYATDFLSGTKGLADGFGDAALGDAGAAFGGTRFAAHSFGWSGSGLTAALFIQRDNAGSSSAQPAGIKISPAGRTGVAGEAAVTDAVPPAMNSTAVEEVIAVTPGDYAVSAFGVLLGYNAGPVDVALNFANGAASYEDETDTTSITELQLALTFGSIRPFLNFGSGTLLNQDFEGNDDARGAIGTAGWNLGVDIGVGPSTVVIAYGSGASTAADDDNYGETRSGFDLMWATNEDPLKVSLAYTSLTTTPNVEVNDPLTQKDETEATTTSKYGVRLDFGF